MKPKMMIVVAGLCIVALAGSACETAGQGTASGALAGAALGAGSGALMGRHSGTGAIVGGVAGALAGGLIGNQLGANNERNNRQDQAIGQAMQDANTAIVNVPTSTGGMVPVRMTRNGGVWVGPRGETYQALPSPEQLRPAYGF